MKFGRKVKLSSFSVALSSVLLVALLSMSSSAQAGVATFDECHFVGGAGSGSVVAWSNAGNWNCTGPVGGNHVPAIGDLAQIDLGVVAEVDSKNPVSNTNVINVAGTLIIRADLVSSGTFTVRNRKARKGRNPQTGATIKIKASKSVGFKPSPKLKGSL